MKILKLMAWALSLGAASPAFAAGPGRPDWVAEFQGSTIKTGSVSVPTGSIQCVTAPSGTTCTSGVSQTGITARRITLQNLDATNPAYCGTSSVTTSGTAATDGFRLSAAGGQIVFQSSARAAIYCRATGGAVDVRVLIEAD